MLTLRQRILITTGTSVGIIIALVLLYLYVIKPRDSEAPKTKTEQAPVVTNTQNTDTIPQDVTVVAPTLPPDEVYTRQMAVMFVERFGTYSNQNNNDHIEDILPLTTDEMARWVETQRQKEGGEYSGLSTNVVASSVESLVKDSATIHIDAQIVADNGKEQITSYKSGKVTLVKEGDAWKISGLYWEH